MIVPDVGATGGEVRVAGWLVQEGARVAAGQPLVALETDKATQEIEAFRGGYLRKILAPVGSLVEIGTVLALIADTAGEPLGDAASVPAAPVKTAATAARRETAPAVANVRPQTVQKSAVAAAPTARGSEVSLTAGMLLDLYGRMLLIRRYEDHLYSLFLQGLVPGTLHQCQGQEAVAVGVSAALRKDDVVFSTHRPVGHLLAKGASLKAVTAEIWGKTTGCAGGKGGQMHLLDVSVGAMPSNAIVGANIPIAVGAGIGFKLRGLDRVAVSYFGDGAANIGTFHEGMNLAAVKDAPVIFVCENNLYAASTSIEMTMRIRDIADRAAGYGIPGVVVDGMDVIAVYNAAATAITRARAGQGPTLLECKTYRYPGHSRGDPGNYRSKEELEAWRRRDPIEQCRRLVLAKYPQNEARLAAIEQACQRAVEEAVQFAQQSEEPPGEACLEHVFAERDSSASESVKGGGTRKMTMAEALRDGLAVAMRADPSVFLLGEDLGVPGGFGGGFTVTLGLSEEFGHQRVMDTPISEAAIVGAAVGAAMTGMKPVAEMQYGDFILCAMDQVCNQAAKMHYMSNGQVNVPMVLRLPVGASRRGAQHGQCSEAWLMHTPGLKVVCPSTSHDAKGLLLAAIRDGNPVMFLEHKLLYGGKGGRKEKTSLDLTGDVPAGDYEVPLGTVAVRRTGADLTILANMLMVHRALAAANELAKEGVEAEVIDVRCLVPLDLATIVQSVNKTRRVLIVEEDNLTCGWGAEVSARLTEACFHDLKAPIARLAAPDTPLPCAGSLEDAYVPSVERIVETAKQLMRVERRRT